MSRRPIIAYRIEPVARRDGRAISTAAIMQCMVTGEVLDGMGGGGMFLSPSVVDTLRVQRTLLARRSAGIPEIGARLAEGQKFNAYATTGDDLVVALGPVSDLLLLAITRSPGAADLITEALRIAHGQPPVLSLVTGDPA